MPSQRLSQFLSHFGALKGNDGHGYQTRCPAHDDQVASLHISESKDGDILLHCFAGCTLDTILAAVGVTASSLFADSQAPESPKTPLPFRKPNDRGTLTAIYDYRDHDWQIVAQKGRFELPDNKKSFLWRAAGTDAWTGLGGRPMTDLALWGAELLYERPAETVYYCEGEKATEACRKAGLLAVTFAGGASARDFGVALDVLAGRNVALWPDNDAPGREYMAVVEARLRGLAQSVRLINMPLPPKGDAFEYFRDGGTVEALESGSVQLNGPSVDLLIDYGIRVSIPSAIGTVRFSFTEIERSARAFDCELSVEVQTLNYNAEPYEDRINILSSSASDTLRRQLEAVFGKELGWTRLINQAFGLARKAYLDIDRSKDLADIEDGNPDIYFAEPLLSDQSINIIFGDGSSLKSYLAGALAFCVSMGLPFLLDEKGHYGITARRGHVLIVDWEDTEENFRRRMKRVAAGYGYADLPRGKIRYFHAGGVPLRDLVGSLLSIIRQHGTVLVIIDSIGPACGGKPEDAEVALAYVRAVAKLRVTTLHLAHITKADIQRGNTNYPFGSVFWSNEARRTWFQQRIQEEDSDDLDVALWCRKVNDGPKPKTLGIKIHFDGKFGPVTLTGSPPSEVPEFAAKMGSWLIVDRALMEITEGTPAEIGQHAGLTAKQVGKILDDNPKRFVRLRKAEHKGRGQAPWIWGRRELSAAASS